jgi:hypothetical protein
MSKKFMFIDKYVFAVGTDATSVNVQETEVLTVTPLELLLPNGQKSDHPASVRYLTNV